MGSFRSRHPTEGRLGTTSLQFLNLAQITIRFVSQWTSWGGAPGKSTLQILKLAQSTVGFVSQRAVSSSSFVQNAIEAVRSRKTPLRQFVRARRPRGWSSFGNERRECGGPTAPVTRCAGQADRPQGGAENVSPSARSKTSGDSGGWGPSSDPGPGGAGVSRTRPQPPRTRASTLSAEHSPRVLSYRASPTEHPAQRDDRGAGGAG
jgi:hypothetical protein